jgi:predicted nucleic-acid-binding protein
MTREILNLDTSVVMRLLVQEPADLYRAAAVFVEEKLRSDVPVHVCDLVLAEAYFALQGFYGMPKAAALEVLAGFVATKGLIFSPQARGVLATKHLAKAKPGFVDRLIHGAGHLTGQTLVTFEKAASKLPSTVVLVAGKEES